MRVPKVNGIIQTGDIRVNKTSNHMRIGMILDRLTPYGMYPDFNHTVLRLD